MRSEPPTRAAGWLEKCWSLAFPVSRKKCTAVSSNDERVRFLLWVDAVGGFLVCTGDSVVLGQPVPGSDVDIPLRGDLSRRHAVIHRDGEGYLIEPVRSVRINGKSIDKHTSLSDGDMLTIGDSVQLRFRRPHPLSQTARLEYASFHRTQPATDGILLMADSCILGPGSASHIVCPRWTQDVVLYRQGGSFGCRCASGVKIDGAEHRQRGPVTLRSQVSGQDFSFSLEPATA